MSTQQAEKGSNPFAEAETWGTSTEKYLGAGNHRVRIVEAQGAMSSNQNPQIDLKFENADGSIKAWERYHEAFLRKVVELFDCAGVARPQPGEFDPADHCRIKQEVLDRLVGKEVGIVVRLEKAFKDPSKEYPNVQGYVPAEKIDASAPAETGSQTQPAAGGSPQASGRAMPF